MRIEAEPFDYDVPTWRAYDQAKLAALGTPEPATTELAGRGLPDTAGEHFVRIAERELEKGDLPECGKAAFLGQVWDGFHNTYWLGLTDGTVRMSYGRQGEPAHHVKQINTSIAALQAVLAVYEAHISAESNDLEERAREDLINQTVIHAVAADAEAFADEESWWSRTFLEIEFSSARILFGEKSLFQLVTQDAAGRWGLDHPGYEDDEQPES